MMRKTFQLMLVLALAAVLMLAAVPAFAELSVQVDTVIDMVGTPPETPETYTVRMEADGDYPMPEGKVGGTYDLTMTGTGSDKFPAITYDTMGVYTYTIKQVAGSYPGATYDSTEYDLKVTVYRNTETNERLLAVALRNSEEEEKVTQCSFLNEYPIEMTTATVKKVWTGAGDNASKRPESLTMTLSGNGEEVGSVVLSADNEWTDTIEDLPKFVGYTREPIEYTWNEPEVEGYDLISIETEGTVTTVTNKHSGPEFMDLSVRKIWIDNNNAQGLRPTVIKAYLYANGKWINLSVTLNAANGWDRTVKNLPVYDENGEKIRYTWREQNIPGYTLIQNYTVGNLTTFVNAIDEYGTPLGLGEVFINVGDCFE